MDNFPLTPTNTNESSLNKPSSPQPKDLPCDYLSSYNTLTPSEEELKNFDSELWQNCDSAFWQDPCIQDDINKLVNSIEPKTPNPDSCTAPTTNMPIAATQPEGLETKDEPSLALPTSLKQYDQADPSSPQPEGLETKDELELAVRTLLGQCDQADPNSPQPEGLETKDEPSLAPPTSLKQYDQADSTLTKPELNELDYIRTCLYALCEPLFMYWKCPMSEHIMISTLKTQEHKDFLKNLKKYLHYLFPPPSSDGQHELQSTRYKEKWNEFYNEARIVINELFKTNHAKVKQLQNNSIEVSEALNHHHSNNTIDPIYSKIKKLCELPLSHTQEEALTSSLQQEALTSLFEAVDGYYRRTGYDSIRSIGKVHQKDHLFNNRPVNNFKVCPVIPELKDLFSGKQQDINDLENKIKELITYINQKTDPDNLIVINNKSMINPKYVTMIKDIIIEKIKQDPDYQYYMPLIKLSVKTNENQWDTDQDNYLRHTQADPLVITCLLDESNTLTKDQRYKANIHLNAACTPINEQFTATLNRILINTSSKKSKNKKKLKQLESQATMAQTPVEPMFMPQMPMAPRTVEPMFMPQMFMAPMPKTNIKRQHTSPGLSPSTEPQTPSKKRKHSNTPPSTPPK